MSDETVKKMKCWACYGSLAYLAGYCPVCNDTGFIEVKIQEPAPGLKPEADSGLAIKKDKLLALSY